MLNSLFELNEGLLTRMESAIFVVSEWQIYLTGFQMDKICIFNKWEEINILLIFVFYFIKGYKGNHK